MAYAAWMAAPGCTREPGRRFGGRPRPGQGGWKAPFRGLGHVLQCPLGEARRRVRRFTQPAHKQPLLGVRFGFSGALVGCLVESWERKHARIKLVSTSHQLYWREK